MKDIFEQRKKDILLKQDKSSKKSVDKKIVSLCNKINSFENYYTTSSCSGRIVLIVDQEKKEKGLFLHVYHDLVTFDNFKNDLDSCSDEFIKFKQQPCFVVVMCKTLESAINLMDLAKPLGFKMSGITSISSNGFCVGLMSTEKIEFPINKKNSANEAFFRDIIEFLWDFFQNL